VISVLREHFTFTASEITKAYQDGCGYAFVAISVGLDAPDSLLKTLRYPKITREFAAQIETHYWQPFVHVNEAVQKQADFRKLTIQSLKRFAKKTDHFFEIKTLTEEKKIYRHSSVIAKALRSRISYSNKCSVSKPLMNT